MQPHSCLSPVSPRFTCVSSAEPIRRRSLRSALHIEAVTGGLVWKPICRANSLHLEYVFIGVT